jgi:pyrroline-5-carboxylate reductase
MIICIGSGNMGTALMKGAAKIAGGGNIGFTDAERPKAEAAAKALGGRVYDSNAEAVREGDFVFLAVKPQVLPAVLEEISPALKERQEAGKPVVLVSMAAGFSISAIRAKLSGPLRPVGPEDSRSITRVPIVRIMPNTPALISQGMIALTASPELGEEKLRDLEKILGAAGVVDRIDEKYMDAVTGLSGSGPAFAYLFIEALADGGVRSGLPRDKALRYAAQTVLGAAAMVRDTGKHPGELKDMVASPAGTTIAGIAALETGAFRGTVISAVNAAYKRSKELG